MIELHLVQPALSDGNSSDDDDDSDIVNVIMINLERRMQHKRLEWLCTKIVLIRCCC